MRKIFSLNLIIGIIGGFVLLLPQNIFAAELTFKTILNNNIANDGATIIEVRIDPESKNLNVIEGTINIDGIKDLSESQIVIETGGSVLTLWPILPEYSPEEKVIRFSGGVPGGFDKEGLLFRMRLFTTIPESEVMISWLGGTAYLNDGKGTKENIKVRSIKVLLTRHDLNEFNKSSYDITPPIFNSIEVGQDPSVYDGKYFISFQAVDDISGIARYEVKEGEITTNVVNNDIYVFKDQTRMTSVIITVYDQAGNSKTMKVPKRYSLVLNIMFIFFGLIILIFVLIYVYRRIKE